MGAAPPKKSEAIRSGGGREGWTPKHICMFDVNAFFWAHVGLERDQCMNEACTTRHNRKLVLGLFGSRMGFSNVAWSRSRPYDGLVLA